MSINITKNGTFRVRKKYPLEVYYKLKLKSRDYDKIFKTKQEAMKAEKEFDKMVQRFRESGNELVFEINGEVDFRDFYEKVWLPAYLNGLTSSYSVPSKATIKNTKQLFRLHILPMFEKYSMNYLNKNKQFVISKMQEKAKTYVNFKILRSYVNQVFDLAEEYEYIERNRLEKALRKIKPLKQIQLKQSKKEEDKFLSFEELQAWFIAVETDFQNGVLSMQDYTLFWTTYFLSDRKSESYALQWKHIDFERNEILLNQALDRFSSVKSTKSKKETIIILPVRLKRILETWKEEQKEELCSLEIEQTDEQFLFTQVEKKGKINQCVYSDYLNYRMNSIERRHPELKHLTPHKLRHTSATLAKQSGMSMQEISEGLTHSDTATTQIYVNTPNIVQLTPADFAYSEMMKKA
jgi:integrase